MFIQDSHASVGNTVVNMGPVFSMYTLGTLPTQFLTWHGLLTRSREAVKAHAEHVRAVDWTTYLVIMQQTP